MARPAVSLLGIVATVGLVSMSIALLWSRPENLLHLELHTDDTPVPVPVPKPELDPWQVQVAQWVNGRPTDNVQDNLRPDMQYITTWVNGGWTNDFMTYINMVYLALLTRRTPVLPPFAPSHVAYDAGFPPFGDVFDVPRLAAALRTPLLEWRDVKRENSTAVDELKCWSTWGLVSATHEPRHSSIPPHLKLDVSYTTLPPSSARVPNMPTGNWLTFSALADVARAPWHAPRPPAAPDSHLLCFDFMYYVGAWHNDEWWEEWSPAWRIVGQHAHWAPRLERLAQGYVRRALGIDDGDESEGFPPYIGVHVRRGDFTAACGHTAPSACFPPLAAYARRVLEIRGVLLAQHGLAIPATHVLVTSDEADPAWWAEVAALGWARLDHGAEQTEARLGLWGAPLLDAVVQGAGAGFVGTDRSTMSLVARRRVEDWQGGVGYLVRIGGPNADD